MRVRLGMVVSQLALTRPLKPTRGIFTADAVQTAVTPELVRFLLVGSIVANNAPLDVTAVTFWAITAA